MPVNDPLPKGLIRTSDRKQIEIISDGTPGGTQILTPGGEDIARFVTSIGFVMRQENEYVAELSLRLNPTKYALKLVGELAEIQIQQYPIHSLTDSEIAKE